MLLGMNHTILSQYIIATFSRHCFKFLHCFNTDFCSKSSRSKSSCGMCNIAASNRKITKGKERLY